MPATGTTPRVHIAKTRSKLADKTVREYAYVRYEVWDPKKGRYQPKPLATLGRTDRLDDGRVESLGGFLKEWLKKDSALPFEARLQDVSATGAAVVGMGGVGYENNAFVQLHMDGIGARDGYIRRAIPEGFAVEFIDNDEEQQKKLEAMAKFRAVSA